MEAEALSNVVVPLLWTKVPLFVQFLDTVRYEGPVTEVLAPRTKLPVVEALFTKVQEPPPPAKVVEAKADVPVMVPVKVLPESVAVNTICPDPAVKTPELLV